MARIYDLEHPACRGAELAFWHRAATAVAPAGPVLELAAGSGRVAIALARKGHIVTGLELSAGMLARAHARTSRLPPAVQQRLTWVQGDMAQFDLGGQHFGLIFIAYNSFWLLTDLTAQERCLQCVARHLAPGGRFILDVFPPNAEDYEDDAGIAQRLAARRRGRAILRVKDYRFDPATRIGTSDVRYYAEDRQTGQIGGLLATFRYRLRMAEPPEVRTLLERQGFAIAAEHGAYDDGPITTTSPRAIYVTRRAQSSVTVSVRTPTRCTNPSRIKEDEG